MATRAAAGHNHSHFPIHLSATRRPRPKSAPKVASDMTIAVPP
jgi:hypothetical protein